MYKITGADGRTYGPVSADQLRQWIAEGRANSRTAVQTEAGTEWVQLGSLTEFADALAASVPPPPVAAVEAERAMQNVLASDYNIEIGRCIGRAWELLQQDFWFLVGAGFVAWVIGAGGFIPYLGFLISLVVGGPMMGGLYALYLRKIRGQTASFGDIFLGFGPAFGSLVGVYLVSMLLTFVGLIFLILPGIYLAVSWIFAVPLVIDRGMDFWAAMELSRKVVTKHWWQTFGFLIVLGLLAIAGLLACVVGIFVTMVISQLALMYAYNDIFQARDEIAIVIP